MALELGWCADSAPQLSGARWCPTVATKVDYAAARSRTSQTTATFLQGTAATAAAARAGRSKCVHEVELTVNAGCARATCPTKPIILSLALYPNGFFTGVMIGARRLLRLS